MSPQIRCQRGHLCWRIVWRLICRHIFGFMQPLHMDFNEAFEEVESSAKFMSFRADLSTVTPTVLPISTSLYSHLISWCVLVLVIKMRKLENPQCRDTSCWTRKLSMKQVLDALSQVCVSCQFVYKYGRPGIWLPVTFSTVIWSQNTNKFCTCILRRVYRNWHVVLG